MYVHQEWPYAHPYSPRTWTLEDWRGYAGGLRKLGYNTIMIWPMLETMPDPLTPSDLASLQRHAQVIDMLHGELGMRVIIVLCPNIVANAAAAKETFEKRHFFWSDVLINPGDASAVDKMIAWRKKLLSYLKKADAVTIIDSDPGGYPNSTNAEFVSLLQRHREMLNELRPGIELDYWILVGWRAWSHFIATGDLQWGTEEDFVDTLSRLKQLNLEPWGIANGLQSPQNAPKYGNQKLNYIEAEHLKSRVISYNYGAIEFEPSLPMTNFGGTAAYIAGSHSDARGVMGNAQTLCTQLPNTFAFVRGALGTPVSMSDYAEFAGRLIKGKGRLIVDAWEALAGTDAIAMRRRSRELREAAQDHQELGDLSGLLFGSGERFLSDLSLQLDLRAAYQELVNAENAGRQVKSALSLFAGAAETWRRQTGYEGGWSSPEMEATLRKLRSPQIDSILTFGPKGSEEVQKMYVDDETYTPRLIQALKDTAAAIN